MTSNEMSIELEKRGIALTPTAVRRWWQRGASKDSADTFIGFYVSERDERGKPMPKCVPTDAVFALLDAVRALPAKRIDAMEQLANAVFDQLESDNQGETNLTGEAFYEFMFAAAAKRTAHIFQILTAFVGMIEMNRRPDQMPDNIKKAVEGLFYGGGLDVKEVWKALGLDTLDTPEVVSKSEKSSRKKTSPVTDASA